MTPVWTGHFKKVYVFKCMCLWSRNIASKCFQNIYSIDLPSYKNCYLTSSQFWNISRNLAAGKQTKDISKISMACFCLPLCMLCLGNVPQHLNGCIYTESRSWQHRTDFARYNYLGQLREYFHYKFGVLCIVCTFLIKCCV